MSKLYLVVVDGYNGAYGASMYALGVYDTKDKAEDAIKNDQASITCENYYRIVELDLNETYHMSDDSYESQNDKYLGGFIE